MKCAVFRFKASQHDTNQPVCCHFHLRRSAKVVGYDDVVVENILVNDAISTESVVELRQVAKAKAECCLHDDDNGVFYHFSTDYKIALRMENEFKNRSQFASFLSCVYAHMKVDV